MDPRVTTKDVTVGEKNYQISKMDARLSCWMFATLGAKASNSGALLTTLGNCSHELFDEIQGAALRHVSLVENKDGNNFLIPIIGNGVIVDKDLANNPSSLFKLTSESVIFNISSFLEESKSSDQK